MKASIFIRRFKKHFIIFKIITFVLSNIQLAFATPANIIKVKPEIHKIASNSTTKIYNSDGKLIGIKLNKKYPNISI